MEPLVSRLLGCVIADKGVKLIWNISFPENVPEDADLGCLPEGSMAWIQESTEQIVQRSVYMGSFALWTV